MYAAGAPADEPGSPIMSARVWCGLMARGWCDEPRENWLARVAPAEPGPAGEPILGGYSLELPDRENLDRAGLTLLVAPERRRTGVGGTLLRHALARAAELGRHTVTSEVMAGTPGDSFARAVGARASLVENRRILDVAAIPGDRLARLRAEATAYAAAYTLTRWEGRTPEVWLNPVAQLNEAMADAPHSDGEQPQVWDAARVRLTDQLSEAKGLRRYSVAAVHAGTGELAALTQLSIEEADPSWGHQEMTAVTRAHRGHRLGLLIKVAMLELLAEREPQVRLSRPGTPRPTSTWSRSTRRWVPGLGPPAVLAAHRRARWRNGRTTGRATGGSVVAADQS